MVYNLLRKNKFEKNCQLPTQTVFVVEDLRNNLLGLPAIVALNLVAQVDIVTTPSSNIVDKIPDLFQGLGKSGRAI